MSLKSHTRWSVFRYTLRRLEPRLDAGSGARHLHGSTPALKNPYFFYDLQRQQGPSANSQIEDPTFSTGRRTFDPTADRPVESMQQRVSKVFGALGSREESRKEASMKGITVAGIQVPARPEEPTNCCMSGCVNCVWELYKDELEEYKSIRREARHRLADPKYDHIKWPVQLGPEPTSRKARNASADEAAAHEADSRKASDEEDDDGLDEGIRAFIATEKRLHEKRQRLRQQQSTQENVI